MKVRLISDWREPHYDHWFDHEGYEFRRVSTEGMSRPEMLRWLSTVGFTTPRHGRVRDIAPLLKKLVVYTDEGSHRGEGKLLLPSIETQEKYPDAYASEYIESPPESFRLLQIGARSWILRYRSDDTWRSNVGEVEIAIQSEGSGYHPHIDAPLFAVDCVYDRDGNRYAVDYNIAPGIRWTGVEDRVSGQEIVALIKAAVARKSGAADE